ncbi:MAG TPA: hypothetical protein VLF18_12680 [Tahibacter sp.]|uniref:hypothetical protein n=1 Tax=Tahibacter sp. TaxID=2056211 RepID=UPI002C2C8294|nr:hypothetical protein [Tahibacter sp.]HSX61051.1 hypothetical protein [Tahibacter sp.]
MSPNRRFVLFASTAGNLVPGDVNGRRYLLIHDRATGDVARIDTGEDAPEIAVPGAAGVSDDGRHIVFDSRPAPVAGEPTNGVDQVYRLGRPAGTAAMLSRGGDGAVGVSASNAGNASADGRFRAFLSTADNLPSCCGPDGRQGYRHGHAGRPLGGRTAGRSPRRSRSAIGIKHRTTASVVRRLRTAA